MIAYIFFFLFISTLAFTNTSTTNGSTSCAQYSSKGCDACISDIKCIYCGDDSTCVEGSIIGPDNHPCKQWYFNFSCKADTLLVLVLIGSGIGAVLLIIVICLCRCMCCAGRKRVKSDPVDFEEIDVDDEDEENEEKKSLTPKSDEIRKKYEEKYPELKEKRKKVNN